MKELTLLIGTCDAYHMLWNNFVTLTNRYWKYECEKIFVTENKIAQYDSYKTIAPGLLPWSNRMLEAIKKIDTEYIFFVLEDYYFTETLSTDEINFHLDFLKSKNGNKIMLEYFCKGYTMNKYITLGNRDIYKLSNMSEYLTSIQPSIWKKSHLINCMRENWSPWDFEIKGTDLIRGRENDTYLALREKKPYWNAVRKGLKISPGWEELRHRECLEQIVIK